MRRTVLAIALSVLLVLAGCSAPTPNASPDAGSTEIEPDTTPKTTTTTVPETASGEATTTTTPADEPSTVSDIEIKNGSLPFDADEMFQNVLELLDEDVSPPLVIEIRGHDTLTSSPRNLPHFAEVMGISDGEAREEVAAAGITRGTDYIGLNARILEYENRTHDVLVHEFVHVVQFKQGYFETARENMDGEGTDGRLTRLAVLEGTPVYVEEQYMLEYTDREPEPANGLGPAYHNATGVQKYAYAPYYYGWRYYDTRLDDPKKLAAEYENPPNTTETVIHALEPGEEPPRRLDVDVSETSWRWSGNDRLGELFLRHSLLAGLPDDRAAAAAAGWGNDRQLTFKNDSRTAYVWALRWDDTSEADEFEDAIGDYLDARGTRVDDEWRVDENRFRVDRPSDEMVVLVIGPDAFTDTATVSGTNTTVNVTA